MITGEPFLEEFFEERRRLVNVLYVLVVGGTLGSAWLRNRRALMQKSLQKA